MSDPLLKDEVGHAAAAVGEGGLSAAIAALPVLTWSAAAERAAESGRTVRFLLRGVPREVTPGGLSSPARLELGTCPRCGSRIGFEAWAGEEVVPQRGTGSGRRVHASARGNAAG